MSFKLDCFRFDIEIGEHQKSLGGNKDEKTNEFLKSKVQFKFPVGILAVNEKYSVFSGGR